MSPSNRHSDVSDNICSWTLFTLLLRDGPGNFYLIFFVAIYSDYNNIDGDPVIVSTISHPNIALLSCLLQTLGIVLDTPLSLHLAVQGSRSKVNARATIHLKYQGIKESRTLDIINLNVIVVISLVLELVRQISQ